MKKLSRILMLTFVLCLMLAVGAMAASGEPSAEPVAEEVLAMDFDVNISINGDVVKTATIGVECEGDVYRFQIAELLDVLGVSLSYDEATGIATITAAQDSELAALMSTATADEPSGEPSAEPAVQEASEEPAVEEASAEPAAEASGEPAANAQPATEAEFAAYVSYCVEFMNAYSGVGDGSFDDSARAMALGELDTVAFGDDVYAFPFEMYVNAFGALDYAAFAAQGAAPAAGGDTSEAAYQEYLCAFVMSCEDILASGAEEEFKALIRTGDYVSFPVEMLFNAQWFGEAAMTYEEFVAAGGIYEISSHLSNGEMPDGTGA